MITSLLPIGAPTAGGSAPGLVAAFSVLLATSLSAWLTVGGVLFCLFLAATVVLALTHKGKARRLYDHQELFESLCRLHQLDRKSRRLLCVVAEYHGLSQPARLFIERRWLYPMNLSPALRARSAELTALRRRLFHSPKPKAERGT